MVMRRDAFIAGFCAMLMGLVGPVAAQEGEEGPSLAGKTVLVTGSTDGLGREVARRLGALGAMVIVHGRNVERGEAVVREIREQGGEAVFYQADFAALDDVRALADAVLENHDRLDMLINNAGISGRGERRTSAEGYELVFAVNYLSHFLLTERLLPLIEQSAPARIVNVSSLGQAPIDFDDVMLTREGAEQRAYSQSKLAQILHTIELAGKLDPARVTVNSLHPATFMDTTMVRQGGGQPRSTVAEGADAVMQLAVSPALEGRTGLFFNGLNEARANDQAYDPEARARLWELSVELTAAADGG
jgi:NAD(P)-dependent dehydrogenase (short-subunit alcohol dehydrogenase family)